MSRTCLYTVRIGVFLLECVTWNLSHKGNKYFHDLRNNSNIVMSVSDSTCTRNVIRVLKIVASSPLTNNVEMHGWLISKTMILAIKAGFDFPVTVPKNNSSLN
jgi:hypothetical protein